MPLFQMQQNNETDYKMVFYQQQVLLWSFSCQEHGLIKGRFRIKSTDDKQYYAIRILKCTDEEGGKKSRCVSSVKEHRRAKRLGTFE